MALSPFAVKVGSAGVLATAGSGLTATYLAWDHIKYYEVERKVMNEDVGFEFDPASETEVKVKTKEDSSKGWKTTGGYYWECKITGTGLSKVEFEARLAFPFLDDFATAKKSLVYLCAQGRTKFESKNVTSEITIPTEVKGDGWMDYLFGSSTLKKVEREVIGKDLKLTISEPAGKKITITAPTTTPSVPTLENNHSWICEIEVTNVETNADSSWKNKLTTNLFSSESTTSPITDIQKTNKALLVKACSKETEKTDSPNTKVKGKLKATESGTSPNKTLEFKDHSELKPLLN